MVFKLIRVDADEPSKQLTVGIHVIGRGKFLHNDDTDKRVSRNHAELEVANDYISLKSLHINPCFYIKKNTVVTEVLEQNSTVSLSNGDKFGLIPDNFWYEVVDFPNSDIPENNRDINENSDVTNGEKQSDMSQAEEQNTMTSDTIKIEGNDDATNVNMSEVDEESNRSSSPSLLKTEPMEQESNQPTGSEPSVSEATTSEPSSPNKRGPEELDSGPDLKKVKKEVDTTDAQPGPSNEQAASNSNGKDQTPAAAPAPPNPPGFGRERCMYGSNCYRRNAQHRAQFSHPTDADWGNKDRGVCPYGRSCRKADPRHWQLNEHPPGVRPPNPSGRGQERKKQRKPRKASVSEDGDSLGSDLIVTGKRSRKTVKRDTWVDTQSDGPEDPYGTDDSDDWKPPSDLADSEDFSQNL